MPDPVSSANSAPNSSHYDPSECDPTHASCAPPPEPQVLTLEPMLIEGRPPRTAPACEREHKAATLGCSLGAAALLVSARDKVAAMDLSGLLISAVREGLSCAKLIGDYDQCKEDGAVRTAAANQCQADGGVPVAGVDEDEVVCLEQP